ncbi:Protein fam43a [Branchiostoma belcheri]|nr:Protein fam43a [Branchiostoma belcheri]
MELDIGNNVHDLQSDQAVATLMFGDQPTVHNALIVSEVRVSISHHVSMATACRRWVKRIIDCYGRYKRANSDGVSFCRLLKPARGYQLSTPAECNARFGKQI